MALEPGHAQRVDDDFVRHVLAQAPVDHHGQEQPALVGGDLEASLALGAYAVQLHELLDALLAHADAAGRQFLPGAGPAVAAVSVRGGQPR